MSLTAVDFWSYSALVCYITTNEIHVSDELSRENFIFTCEKITCKKIGIAMAKNKYKMCLSLQMKGFSILLVFIYM